MPWRIRGVGTCGSRRRCGCPAATAVRAAAALPWERVGRLGVEVEHVLHVGDEVRVHLRDAPHLLLPGLDVLLVEPPSNGAGEMDSRSASSTSGRRASAASSARNPWAEGNRPWRRGGPPVSRNRVRSWWLQQVPERNFLLTRQWECLRTLLPTPIPAGLTARASTSRTSTPRRRSTARPPRRRTSPSSSGSHRPPSTE